jgi:hypothetical protein
LRPTAYLYRVKLMPIMQILRWEQALAYYLESAQNGSCP